MKGRSTTFGYISAKTERKKDPACIHFPTPYRSSKRSDSRSLLGKTDRC